MSSYGNKKPAALPKVVLASLAKKIRDQYGHHCRRPVAPYAHSSGHDGHRRHEPRPPPISFRQYHEQKARRKNHQPISQNERELRRLENRPFSVRTAESIKEDREKMKKIEMKLSSKSKPLGKRKISPLSVSNFTSNSAHPSPKRRAVLLSDSPTVLLSPSKVSPSKSSPSPKKPTVSMLDPLVIVSIFKATKNLTRMLLMKNKIPKAGTPACKQYLLDIKDLAERYIHVFHQWCQENENEIKPTPLTSTNAMDGSVYRKGNKTGQSGRHTWVRVDEQIPSDSEQRPRDVASNFFLTNECVELMSRSIFKPFLDEAIKFEPPRLQYHKDMKAEEREAICRQFIEMGVAAYTRGYTHEVFEGFILLPSKEIEKTIEHPKGCNPKSVALVKTILDIDAVLTWGHFRSHLQNLKDSETMSDEQIQWLCANMRDMPEDEFATWHLIRRCFGYHPNLKQYTDAIPADNDVRTKQMEQLVQNVLSVLTEPVLDKFARNGKHSVTISNDLCTIMNAINKDSGDCSWYNTRGARSEI